MNVSSSLIAAMAAFVFAAVAVVQNLRHKGSESAIYTVASGVWLCVSFLAKGA